MCSKKTEEREKQNTGMHFLVALNVVQSWWHVLQTACTFLWLCMWCSLGGMFCRLACLALCLQAHGGMHVMLQGTSITAQRHQHHSTGQQHHSSHQACIQARSAISSRASGMQPAGTCSHQACMDYIQPSGMHGIHICYRAAAFRFCASHGFPLWVQGPHARGGQALVLYISMNATKSAAGGRPLPAAPPGEAVRDQGCKEEARQWRGKPQRFGV